MEKEKVVKKKVFLLCWE